MSSKVASCFMPMQEEHAALTSRARCPDHAALLVRWPAEPPTSATGQALREESRATEALQHQAFYRSRKPPTRNRHSLPTEFCRSRASDSIQVSFRNGKPSSSSAHRRGSSRRSCREHAPPQPRSAHGGSRQGRALALRLQRQAVVAKYRHSRTLE